MGKYSNEVKRKISKLASKFLVNVKVNIIWKSPRKLSNLFTYNDRLPMRYALKYFIVLRAMDATPFT